MYLGTSKVMYYFTGRGLPCFFSVRMAKDFLYGFAAL